MRKALPPEAAVDVPTWLMTYSDVITLLMTFFILLLTFATNEPEKFERMQISLFGGGGATGIAGPLHGALDLDTIVLRERPRAGRLTQRGSEMPPLYADAAYESLSNGIAGLEQRSDVDNRVSLLIVLPLSLLIDSSGELTPLAHQRFRMVARQLHRGPFELTMNVSSREDIPHALQCADHLVSANSVLPGKIGVGVRDVGNTTEHILQLVLTHAPGGQ